MINPISQVSFKAELPKMDAMGAINKTQQTLATITNLSQGTDEFKKNLKTDQAAYSDGITDSLKEAAKDNKALAPIAKVAESKAGKKLADIFGGFTAFCTSLAGAATSVAKP